MKTYIARPVQITLTTDRRVPGEDVGAREARMARLECLAAGVGRDAVPAVAQRVRFRAGLCLSGSGDGGAGWQVHNGRDVGAGDGRAELCC